MDIPDRLLFGQFLIEKQKITKEMLYKALEIQKDEDITDHPRMLGSILYNDFHAFENRIELKRYLDSFDNYRQEIRKIYLDAKIYGMEAADKLDEEYADLMEELESAPTTKIRELITVIEKFKIAIRETKEKEKEIERLKFELEKVKNDKDREIISLKRELEDLRSTRQQELKRIDGYVKKLKNRPK